MVAKNTETQREVIDNLRIDVGVIKSQMGEVRELQKSMTAQMGSFTFAKQVDVDKQGASLEVLENKVTVLQQKLKPIEKIYYLISGALVTGIIGTGFYLLQKALGK